VYVGFPGVTCSELPTGTLIGVILLSEVCQTRHGIWTESKKNKTCKCGDRDMKYHVSGQDTCLETSSLFSGIDVGEPASRDTPLSFNSGWGQWVMFPGWVSALSSLQ